MDLLITLIVLAVGFMVFGSLFYGAAKVFGKKHGHDDLSVTNAERKSVHLRINRSHNVYSFK